MTAKPSKSASRPAKTDGRLNEALRELSSLYVQRQRSEKPETSSRLNVRIYNLESEIAAILR